MKFNKFWRIIREDQWLLLVILCVEGHLGPDLEDPGYQFLDYPCDVGFRFVDHHGVFLWDKILYVAFRPKGTLPLKKRFMNRRIDRDKETNGHDSTASRGARITNSILVEAIYFVICFGDKTTDKVRGWFRISMMKNSELTVEAALRTFPKNSRCAVVRVLKKETGEFQHPPSGVVLPLDDEKLVTEWTFDIWEFDWE